jgi:hypothetical protein
VIHSISHESAAGPGGRLGVQAPAVLFKFLYRNAELVVVVELNAAPFLHDLPSSKELH